jgi:hypothetical protein
MVGLPDEAVIGRRPSEVDARMDAALIERTLAEQVIKKGVPAADVPLVQTLAGCYPAARHSCRRPRGAAAAPEGHQIPLLILVLAAVVLAAAGPRCQVLHEPRGSSGREGWIFTWIFHRGGCLPRDSEQITSAPNIEKSMVAGVDIRRLHGYSFTRSPERKQGLARDELPGSSEGSKQHPGEGVGCGRAHREVRQ